MRRALLVGLLAVTSCSGHKTTGPHIPLGVVVRDIDLPPADAPAMPVPTEGDPQLRMTMLQPASRDDSLRVAQVVAIARAATARFVDPAMARANGFVDASPAGDRSFRHLVDWSQMSGAMFDPARPAALLYSTRWQLLGVMYMAPADAPLDTLNARLPLGLVRWHQHVNWCVGAPRDLADPAACRAAGGRFVAHVYGWMAHLIFEHP